MNMRTIYLSGALAWLNVVTWGATSTALGQHSGPAGYAIAKLGLAGPEYEYSLGSGFVRDDRALFMTDSGGVPGHTKRYGAAGVSLGQDTWMYDGTTTQLIGFTGGPYEYVTAGGGVYRTSEIALFNSSAHAAGYTSRFSPTGMPLGYDAWLYDGDSVRPVGLTGDAGGATYGLNGLRFINAAGHLAGTTARQGNSSGLGADAWFFDGATTRRVGPTGSEYEYIPAGGGIRRLSEPQGLTAAGQVIGRSLRVNAAAYVLGEDAWVFNGTTRLIGLFGPGYEYAVTGSGGGTGRASRIWRSNQAGQVTGYSERHLPGGGGTGQDAWFYNGVVTQLVGLTGSGYEYTSTFGDTHRVGGPGSLSNSGYVTGTAARYTASGGNLGDDAWLFDGTTTRLIGLTGGEYEYDSTGSGGGRYRNGNLISLNEAGQVLGHAARFSSSGASLGRDIWLHAGTATQRIGLTGVGYEYATVGGIHRVGDASRLNQAGQVMGVARRFSASGAHLGTDAWQHEGTTTRRIGLTGSGYEYTNADGLFRAGDVLFMNEAGEIVGRTSRYDNGGVFLGVSGWFFDDETGITTPLEFSFRPSDNYSFTAPALLTAEGAVLGSYELFDATNSQRSRAFLWSAADGFHDLGALVDGGLHAAGWQALWNVYSGFGATGAGPMGSPRHIVGTGFASGQVAGQSVYLLSAIPEPPTLALLTWAGLSMLTARKRVTGSAGHRA